MSDHIGPVVAAEVARRVQRHPYAGHPAGARPCRPLHRPDQQEDDVSVHELLLKYLELREIPMPEITTGRKVLEEARELVEAIASGDEVNICDEIADVVLTAAVIAHSRGVSVEDCILAKTCADVGRGGGPLPEERGEPIPDWRVPAWSTQHL